MVLSTNPTDSVIHNAITYGSGAVYNGGTYQNIFTAVNTAATINGSAVIIDYIDIKELSISGDFIPGNIYFKQRLTTGSLLLGSYQYAYQLENKNGSFTNWSPLSMTMYNPNSNNVSNIDTLSYANFIGNKPGEISTTAMLFSIDNLDVSIYSNIRVAFVYSKQIGVYENPDIFYYAPITASTMDIIHYGNEVGFGTINLDTLTTINQSLDLVKTITSTKNILFAANIGQQIDPLIDLSNDIEVRTIEYRLPADTQAARYVPGDIASGYAIFGHHAAINAVAGTVVAETDQWYEADGGTITTDSVTYNGVEYYRGGASGAYFKGVSGTTTITENGTGRARHVIRIQKYTGVYVYHRIVDDYLDFKGVTASHYLKSHWRDETYRYGFQTYGKKGQPNFVFHVMDKRIPKQFKTTADTEIIKNDGTTANLGIDCALLKKNAAQTAVTLSSLGLDFSKIDFNVVAAAYGCTLAQLSNFVSGFSIVRCERDKQIIHQGMLWPNVDNGNIVPIVTNDLVGDNNYSINQRKHNSYMYYSPDQLNGFDNTITSIDTLEIADKYMNYMGATTNVGTSLDDLVTLVGVGINRYISKFYTVVRTALGTYYDAGQTTNIDSKSCVNIDPFQTNASIPGVGLFDNISTTSVACTDEAGNNQFLKTALGGKGLYVQTTGDEITYPAGFGSQDGGGGSIQPKSLVNWKRANNNLYGGSTEVVKATSKYINCGHYQPLDSAFVTYMIGTSGGKLTGIVNNIEVFGGDTFVSLFGYARMSADIDNFSSKTGNGFVIPIESNQNENWRGWLDGVAGITNNDSATRRTLNANRFFNTTATELHGIHGRVAAGNYQLESLNNFDAYIGNEKQYFFLARPFNFVSSIRDEQLVMRSLIKINGETIDNWKIFLTNNQIRVDSLYGPINNIRAKGTRLFYWQSKGVGNIPILERQMDSTLLGGAVQMGVGGIMDRFDEMDYYYGNQHQMGLMENENSYSWFDLRRRSLMYITINGESIQISDVKGLSNHFYTFFQTLENLATTTSIFNSDSPLDEKGIISYYDPRFKLGLMAFKINSTLSGGTNLNFTIGLDSHLNKFVGFFDIDMNHAIVHNGHLLLTHLSGKELLDNTAYSIGDEVGLNGINYVCILAYTSGSPATAVNIDTTHWLIKMSINQVHIAWRGYICHIFGVSRTFYLTVILKSKDLTNISVDHVEVSGNDTPFTDIFISNQYESASDINLTKTTAAFVVLNKSRDYKYFDGSWWFGLPLKNKRSRLVDHYVELKMQVKYVLIDIPLLVKRITYVKSFFRKKL